MLKDALTLSALIAAVLLVRAAFKNRVPKRLLYALWLVVLLKLCLPGTAYALPLLPAEQTAAVQQTEAPAQPAPAAQQPAQAFGHISRFKAFPYAGKNYHGYQEPYARTESVDQRLYKAKGIRRCRVLVNDQHGNAEHRAVCGNKRQINTERIIYRLYVPFKHNFY